MGMKTARETVIDAICAGGWANESANVDGSSYYKVVIEREELNEIKEVFLEEICDALELSQVVNTDEDLKKIEAFMPSLRGYWVYKVNSDGVPHLASHATLAQLDVTWGIIRRGEEAECEAQGKEEEYC